MGKNPSRGDIGGCGRSFLDPRSLLLSGGLRKLWLRARLVIIIQRASVVAISPRILRIALNVVLQRFISLPFVLDVTRKHGFIIKLLLYRINLPL